MLGTLRRPSLERALQAAIVATIFTAVLAAGAILSLLDAARKLRWLALLALLALAVAYAVRNGGGLPSRAVAGTAAAFLALGLVSAGWSSDPRNTAGRAGALAVLFVACLALARGAAGRAASVRMLLDAVLWAVAAVAAGGLVVLAVAHDRAVQPGSTLEAARYQGLGGGPDTAVMVMAVGMPLAAHAARAARTSRGRVAAVALLLLLAGSIVASGSRGSLLAGFGGLAAYGVLGVEGLRRRALVGAAVLAALAAAFGISRLPRPSPNASPPNRADPSPSTVKPRSSRFLDANRYLRLQDDIGHPQFGQSSAPTHRTIFGSSGRAEAWDGVIRLGAERPLLGYGFGAEGRVFVDRWVNFDSNTPENSYLGVFLQLGLVGLAAFLALVAALLARVRRAVDRRLAAACAGGFVAGLLLAVTQSFVYAAGSNATAAVWLCAFLLVAATAKDTRAPA